jgi:hypothetical protein
MDKDNYCPIRYLIIQDGNIGGSFYRIYMWFQNDPKEYQIVIFEHDWIFDTLFKDMNEGDIINSKYICKSFTNEYCKELVLIV